MKPTTEDFDYDWRMHSECTPDRLVSVPLFRRPDAPPHILLYVIVCSIVAGVGWWLSGPWFAMGAAVLAIPLTALLWQADFISSPNQNERRVELDSESRTLRCHWIHIPNWKWRPIEEFETHFDSIEYCQYYPSVGSNIAHIAVVTNHGRVRIPADMSFFEELRKRLDPIGSRADHKPWWTKMWLIIGVIGLGLIAFMVLLFIIINWMLANPNAP